MANSDILIQNVLEIAESEPEKIFAKLLFPNAGGVEITYRDLIQKASRFANFYRAKRIGKNHVVVLMLPHGREIMDAFVGAWLSGAIPSIFAYPSIKLPLEEYRKTLPLLLKACGARAMVTTREFASELAQHRILPVGMRVLSAKDSGQYSEAPGTPPFFGPNDIALLQHSSGTTGLKKGVALSNRSVSRQIENYALALELRDQDKIVSWLPLYHDMGLIACFILPMVRGIPLVMMSPFDWVADPGILLKAIARERGTLCWLPNFAYNLLASRVSEDEAAGLDLSAMRAFINCSEPISTESHELFYNRFKQHGLRAQALCTSYAMAENTFAVTQGGIGEPVPVENMDGRKTVSSGRPIRNNEVRIVSPKFTDLPDRQVGEITIRSDSMMAGYYRRPELTRKAMKKGWYLTGDLGYLSNGHLFVTGRKKDMIIVAGKNIYPQDIEEIVSKVEGIYPGRVVAFGLYDREIGTEEITIVAETKVQDKSRHAAIKLAVAKSVRERLDCAPGRIALVPPRWLVKSSSGKISRNGNRDKYLLEIKDDGK